MTLGSYVGRFVKLGWFTNGRVKSKRPWDPMKMGLGVSFRGNSALGRERFGSNEVKEKR